MEERKMGENNKIKTKKTKAKCCNAKNKELKQATNKWQKRARNIILLYECMDGWMEKKGQESFLLFYVENIPVFCNMICCDATPLPVDVHFHFHYTFFFSSSASVFVYVFVITKKKHAVQNRERKKKKTKTLFKTVLVLTWRVFFSCCCHCCFCFFFRAVLYMIAVYCMVLYNTYVCAEKKKLFFYSRIKN